MDLKKVLQKAVEVALEKKLVNYEGLQRFLENLVKTFARKEHTHEAAKDIIEDTEHRFVTDEQIAAFLDKYTKLEIDDKFAALKNGMTWRDPVETFDDIATTYPEPKDTWTVLVKDTNHVYVYEEDLDKWVDLEDLVVHDLAQADQKGDDGSVIVEGNDGLMSKEDKYRVDHLEDIIKENATGENATASDVEIDSLFEKLLFKFFVCKIMDGVTEAYKEELKEGTVWTPEAPAKDGYELEGIYKDEQFAEKVEGDITVTEDTTLYAKYLKLFTCTVMDGEEVLSTEKVAEGKEWTPSASKEGYINKGIYKEAEFTTPADDKYTVTEDITVYANLVVGHKVEVIDLADGTTKLVEELVAEGEQWEEPVITKEGHKVVELYDDAAKTTVAVFPKEVTAPITVYAETRPLEMFTCKIMNGDTEVSSEEIQEDSEWNPQLPEIPGYISTGLYEEETFVTEVQLPIVVTEDITIYVKTEAQGA